MYKLATQSYGKLRLFPRLFSITAFYLQRTRTDQWTKWKLAYLNVATLHPCIHFYFRKLKEEKHVKCHWYLCICTPLWLGDYFSVRTIVNDNNQTCKWQTKWGKLQLVLGLWNGTTQTIDTRFIRDSRFEIEKNKYFDKFRPIIYGKTVPMDLLRPPTTWFITLMTWKWMLFHRRFDAHTWLWTGYPEEIQR